MRLAIRFISLVTLLLAVLAAWGLYLVARPHALAGIALDAHPKYMRRATLSPWRPFAGFEVRDVEFRDRFHVVRFEQQRQPDGSGVMWRAGSLRVVTDARAFVAAVVTTVALAAALHTLLWFVLMQTNRRATATEPAAAVPDDRAVGGPGDLRPHVVRADDAAHGIDGTAGDAPHDTGVLTYAPARRGARRWRVVIFVTILASASLASIVVAILASGR